MIKTYRKNGKKYFEVFVLVRDSTGKQIARRRKGITSERKAKDIEFEIKAELKAITKNEVTWTWGLWLEECLKRMKLTRRQSTMINYTGRLNKWIPSTWKDQKLSEFTKAQVHELLFEDLISEMSKQSLKNLLKMISRVFEMAVEEGVISVNPCRGLSVKVPQRQQKVLTAGEAEKLLKAAKETGHRFYPIWAFALMTGMRSGEMYALQWSDIDLEAGIISLSRNWTSKDGFGPTKTGDTRVVPISRDLRRLLKELRLRSKTENVLPRLREWTNGEQALVLREFCKSIGITPVKFHDLRATFITNLLAQGVPLVKVMSVVGHRKMSTTDVYLRLAGVDVKDVTESLGYQTPNDAHANNVVSLKGGV